MKRLVLLAIAVCAVQLAFSQTDFRRGYIITATRDTLFGLVDYRERDKTYKSCDFKISKDQNTITYGPKDILGYGFISDKFFASREVTVKGQLPSLVFVEVVVKGLVSLYRYEALYFVEKNNNGLQQLINERTEDFVEGKRVWRYSNQHIATLNMLLFDCSEVREKIQETTVNQKPLTNLIEKYNRCTGQPSVTFKARKPWTKAIVGISGGLNVSELSFITMPDYEHLAGTFELSKSPMIGLSLDLLSPRLSERFSFHGDLFYLTSKYYNYTHAESPSSKTTNYVTIELRQLKIPVGVRYTFPKRKLTPYFNLGLSTTRHLHSVSQLIKEVEADQVVFTYEGEATPVTKNQVGVWAGAGVIKSITSRLDAFVTLNYDQTEGISNRFEAYPYFVSSKVINFQFTIGLRTK